MKFDFATLGYPKKFEEMCNQIVIAKYPSAKPIDGSGGDNGIDCCVSNESDGLHVFQHKYFIGRLNTSRKKQIHDSLQKATFNKPVAWTLCIPIDFTIKEKQWFDGLKEIFNPIEIDYWGAGRLEYLLHTNQEIKNHYFPNVTEQLKILNAHLDDKGLLGSGSAADILDGAQVLHDSLQQLNSSYLYDLSITEDGPRIAIRPRSFENESVPPLNVHTIFRFPNTTEGRKNQKALTDFIDRGVPVEIPGEYIAEWTSDLEDLLGLNKGAKPALVRMGPTDAFDKILLTFVIDQPGETKDTQLGPINMKIERQGRQEFAISNKEEQPALLLSVVMNRKKKKLELAWELAYDGHNIKEVVDCERFLRSLALGSKLKIINTQNGMSTEIEINMKQEWPEWRQTLLEGLIAALNIQISSGMLITFSDDMTDSDKVALATLAEVSRSGRIDRSNQSVTLTMTKVGATELLKVVDGTKPMEIETAVSSVDLFGVSLPLGKSKILLHDANISGDKSCLDKTIRALDDDDSIKIKVESPLMTINYHDFE